MRSGGGGVAIGRGPSTTSTSPPTGSSELESQHVDRVGLTQAEVDLVRREQPPRLHPVPLRLLQVGPAEGDQLVALKPADHSRARHATIGSVVAPTASSRARETLALMNRAVLRGSRAAWAPRARARVWASASEVRAAGSWRARSR